MVRLAIDMMGSDLGPTGLIPGVKALLKDYDDVELHLFGDENILKESFTEENVIIHGTEEIVPMEVGALKVLRMKNSSMMKAVQCTVDEDLDGVVSAGSTGGFLTLTTLIVKNVEGVLRAGLCAPFLTVKKGKYVAILDIGASNENTAEELACFAKLGKIYSSTMWNIENPSVYLLNNGAEEGKGPDYVKGAYKLLKEDSSINFQGNVEARYVMDGKRDVVVSAGFPGNIYLKASEGMASNMNMLIKNAFSENIFSKIGYLLARRGFKHMKEIMNYKKVGGAIALGAKIIWSMQLKKSFMNRKFIKFFEDIGVSYNNINLYSAALTHISYINEHPDAKNDYDRLEFIGDSVLDIVLADLLYKHFPNSRSGTLSKLRSYFVNGASLAKLADKLDILRFARLSNGEQNNSLDRNKLKEDMFEAFLGAMYLDHNYEYVYKFISDLFLPQFDNVTEENITDNKTRLQELLQSQGHGKIEYKVIEEKGNAQKKHYKVAVIYDGVILGVGEGTNKKIAQQEAAGDALTRKVN